MDRSLVGHRTWGHRDGHNWVTLQGKMWVALSGWVRCPGGQRDPFLKLLSPVDQFPSRKTYLVGKDLHSNLWQAMGLVQFSHSVVSDSATPWFAARQAFLSITNSRSLLKLVSVASVMPSSHLILCRPFLLLPWIFLNIRVFSNEPALHIRWPKYWGVSASTSVLPINVQSFSDNFGLQKTNTEGK